MKFQIESLRGTSTRVNLYIDGLKNSSSTLQTTSSIERNMNNSNLDIQIIKVSEELKSSKEVPSFRAELYLRNLDRNDLHKYCIPKESNLKNQTISTSSETIGSCEWKTLSDTPPNGLDKETIKYLLKVITDFVRVEHLHNMFVLYDSKTHFWNNKNTKKEKNSNGIEEKIKNIGKGCNLEGKNSKETLKDLFLSTDYSKKSCLPAPIFSVINLKIENNSEVQATSQNNSQITKNSFSKGKVSGKLSYSLFDYWAQPKSTKEENNKFPIFTFSTENKYSLEESKTCSLKKMYSLVDSRELRLSDFFNKYCRF